MKMSALHRYLRPAIGSLVALCVIVILAIFSSNGALSKVSLVRPVQDQPRQTDNWDISWSNILQGGDQDGLDDYSEDSFLEGEDDDGSQETKTKLTPQSRVVFNRVGKCGSRTVLTIFKTLADRNNFKFYGSEINNITHIPLRGQIELVNIISSLRPPFIYQRHFHFIDFQRFGAIEPVYINIIRDPVNRFVSQYYFKRFGDEQRARRFYKGSEKGLNMSVNECVLSNNYECSGKKLHYIVPFFCGQDERCRTPSRWALDKAISNLSEKFLVVGFIEELEQTLQVFEQLIPDMFEGALGIYKQPAAEKTQQTSTKHKEPVTEEVRKIMMDRMAFEYEFHDFAKKKFEVIKNQLGIAPSTR